MSSFARHGLRTTVAAAGIAAAGIGLAGSAAALPEIPPALPGVDDLGAAVPSAALPEASPLAGASSTALDALHAFTPPTVSDLDAVTGALPAAPVDVLGATGSQGVPATLPAESAHPALPGLSGLPALPGPSALPELPPLPVAPPVALPVAGPSDADVQPDLVVGGHDVGDIAPVAPADIAATALSLM